MKIAVITGEESGDKLAASILRKLKNSTDNSIDLYGICLLYTSDAADE